MNINIISQGGIGNQLFQAAAAHEIAILYPEFRVNFINANHRSGRPFALYGFFSNCSHVSESVISDLITPGIKSAYYRNKRKQNIILNLFFKKAINFESLIIDQQSVQHVTNLISKRLNKTIFLDGYFQSTDYVGANKTCFNGLFQNYVTISKSKNRNNYANYAVMHVRKGDYHENPAFGPLSLKYFQLAMKQNIQESCQIIIHSDGNQKELKSLIVDARFDLGCSFSENPWDLIWDARNSKMFFGSNSTLSFWASYALDVESLFTSNASYFPDEWHVGVSVSKFEIYSKKWNLLKSDWDNQK